MRYGCCKKNRQDVIEIVSINLDQKEGLLQIEYAAISSYPHRKSRNKNVSAFLRVSKRYGQMLMLHYSTPNGDEPDVCYAMNQQHDDHSNCEFWDRVFSDQGDDYLKQ